MHTNTVRCQREEAPWNGDGGEAKRQSASFNSPAPRWHSACTLRGEYRGFISMMASIILENIIL